MGPCLGIQFKINTIEAYSNIESALSNKKEHAENWNKMAKGKKGVEILKYRV